MYWCGSLLHSRTSGHPPPTPKDFIPDIPQGAIGDLRTNGMERVQFCQEVSYRYVPVALLLVFGQRIIGHKPVVYRKEWWSAQDSRRSI